MGLLEEFQHPGSVLGATVNLGVCMIGAGVLALPTAFADAGIAVASVTIAIVGFFTVLSIRYLAICIEKLNLYSYEELSHCLLGNAFESFARWMLIFYNFGAAVGYVVVMGELLVPLHDLIQGYFPMLTTSTRAMIAFWAVVMLPMSLIRNVSSLRYSSFLAIASSIYISVAIIYRYFVPHIAEHRHGHNSPAAPIRVEFVQVSILMLLSLPIMMYSFDCQVLVYQLYANLHEATSRKMTKVAVGSVIIATTVYYSVGLFGYLSHGDKVKGNILNNYDPNTDVLMGLGYVFYATPIVMAFALMLFPCRDSVFNTLWGISPGHIDAIDAKTFYTTSATISFGSAVVAIAVPGIVSVIGILGGLCSSTLCFTYPALFLLSMTKRGIIQPTLLESVGMYSMLALGVGGAIFGTAVAVYKTYTMTQ